MLKSQTFILVIEEVEWRKAKLDFLRTLPLIENTQTHKKLITILSLFPRPPNVKPWLQEVNEVFIMEKVTAELQLKNVHVFKSLLSSFVAFCFY